MKKLLTICFLFTIALVSSGYQKPNVYEIDAIRNAYLHNNVALQYVFEENYASAIQEFQIAIALNPKTQATAVYYNNLGETYMKIGLYQSAQVCFENAIKQYSLSFKYYQNLAKCFKAQNVVNQQLNIYAGKGKNPLNMIMLGLLYIEKGDVKRGIIKLDEFCMQEPDLLITGAVKNYLKEMITQN